MIDPQIALEV